MRFIFLWMALMWYIKIKKTRIIAPSSITSLHIHGETMKTGTEFIFLRSKITADCDCSCEKKKKKRNLLFGKKETIKNLESILKSKDIPLPVNLYIIKAMAFSRSHGWMWELDHKENWVSKNWCFWTVVLDKTPESPLNCKEIQPVHPKENRS